MVVAVGRVRCAVVGSLVDVVGRVAERDSDVVGRDPGSGGIGRGVVGGGWFDVVGCSVSSWSVCVVGHVDVCVVSGRDVFECDAEWMCVVSGGYIQQFGGSDVGVDVCVVSGGYVWSVEWCSECAAMSFVSIGHVQCSVGSGRIVVVQVMCVGKLCGVRGFDAV